MDEGIELLTKMFQGRPWFHSVGVEKYGRYVVYTNFMCHETLHDVPDRVNNKQVLVHFAASMTSTASQFTNTPAAPKLQLVLDEPEPEAIEEIDSSLLERDLSELCRKLDKLEKICGSNRLQDIFYEVHDGKNAITNLSSHYPEVRAAMEELYDEYGFDVIYEELDG